MSKRSNESNIYFGKGIKILKTLPTTTAISSLPNEMLAEIISKLNEIEDLRTCMLLCKRFRDSTLRSPETMRHIVVKLTDHHDLYEIASFIQKYGVGIKHADLEIENALSILRETPNVEELALYANPLENWALSRKSVELPRLKWLYISGPAGYSTSFLMNVTNIESLMIVFREYMSGKILTNFIAQQNNLKRLKYLCVESSEPSRLFPIRDISQECKFQLTELTYECDYCNENFPKFLEKQLKILTELTLNTELDFNILNILFKNGKKLKSLTLNALYVTLDVFLFSRSFPDWVLPNVKFFSTNVVANAIEFTRIFKRFPRVDTLSFKALPAMNKIVPQLQTLHIGYLDCKILQNMKMPNLKNLTFHFIFNLDFLERFSQNVKNLEQIVFTSENEENLDFVKNFKKLQKFEYRIGRQFCHFRILVDFCKKIVYRNKESLSNLEIIEKNFPNFEIIEDEKAMSNSLFLGNFTL